MPYCTNCSNCPYLDQNHLKGSNYVTQRPDPPIELEDNGSPVLLVFQAPGVVEWNVGKAIQPTKKQGGTAGSRLEKSWKTKGRQRSDFDIINAVQCFPGNPGGKGDRDYDPDSAARTCCAVRFTAAIKQKNYSEIIAFGHIAQTLVNQILPSLTNNPKFTAARHPSGGCSNSILNSLW
jgi:uracil-DNA glycosylase